MAVLTSADLRGRISASPSVAAANAIVINPCDIERCLTPMGYDLCVGETFRRYTHNSFEKLKRGEKIRIAPGETVLVVTSESIDMPRDGSLSALIVSKASVVAKGFAGISTKVDPGWCGSLRVSVQNVSRVELSIEYGQPFCTIVFLANQTPEVDGYRKRDHNPLGLPERSKRPVRWLTILTTLSVLLAPLVVWQVGAGDTLITASVAVAIFVHNVFEKVWPGR